MMTPDTRAQGGYVQDEGFQAPEGTYDYLIGLPEGRLGNAHTKHFVTIFTHGWYPVAAVNIRSSDNKRTLFPYDNFSFNIDDENVARNISATRTESADQQGIPLEGDSATIFERAIEELGSAKRLAESRERR